MSPLLIFVIFLLGSLVGIAVGDIFPEEDQDKSRIKRKQGRKYANWWKSKNRGPSSGCLFLEGREDECPLGDLVEFFESETGQKHQ